MEVLAVLAAVCSAVSAVCGGLVLYLQRRERAPGPAAEAGEDPGECADLTRELMNLMRYSVGEKREEK